MPSQIRLLRQDPAVVGEDAQVKGLPLCLGLQGVCEQGHAHAAEIVHRGPDAGSGGASAENGAQQQGVKLLQRLPGGGEAIPGHQGQQLRKVEKAPAPILEIAFCTGGDESVKVRPVVKEREHVIVVDRPRALALGVIGQGVLQAPEQILPVVLHIGAALQLQRTAAQAPAQIVAKLRFCHVRSFPGD